MISDEVVQRIRRYRNEGVSLREISRTTGISVNTIRRYRYLSRYSYKFGPSSGVGGRGGFYTNARVKIGHWRHQMHTILAHSYPSVAS